MFGKWPVAKKYVLSRRKRGEKRNRKRERKDFCPSISKVLFLVELFKEFRFFYQNIIKSIHYDFTKRPEINEVIAMFNAIYTRLDNKDDYNDLKNILNKIYIVTFI